MKRPTQMHVAHRAGVSRATVSYVLNGLTDTKVAISEGTRQRVMDAIKELGYVPDARGRALRSGDAKVLGLTIPDIHNPHFWQIAEGVEQEAREAGYNLMLSSMELKYEYANEIFTNLLHRRVDGLILMGPFVFDSEEAHDSLRHFFDQRLPIVEMTDYERASYSVDRVMSAYHAAASEAMSYLLGLNHKRIGIIYGVAERELATDRLQPYKEGLVAAGLPVDEELIIECGTTMDDGYHAAQKLLALSTQPTAIIAINDLLATGAMRAIAEAGLSIPGNISLLGFDDIPAARFMVPSLTTVSKNVSALGRTAVKLLLARIQDPERPFQVEKGPARLIIRESTGPAPY